MNVTFTHTTSNDADTLVQIRIDAMRESLERIGRFDPVRARDRFLASFDARYCRYILVDGEKAGFVLVRPESAHLLLDHLYIVPAHQGKGVGAAVLDAVLADADAQRLPVKVGALRESASNRFYQRHGFVKTAESEWDLYYVREPRPVAAQSV
ncbi:GNAT family N-acetyltransferase [Paraburkholderia phenazinium]|uniref:Acetyltransferase (GNAT) domain-containing protein n=1 Tax=Paraburkholderia phenazinium TaxID=60549 RepID=A0A1G8BWX6_9BURK|nr:GNAT family N-acetyltransferase [Paraburkholderia phenazinium]SDH37220.1 Acetyltransferase (GNAT) domain-containing protein [Paraburkholderia phenazinium]